MNKIIEVNEKFSYAVVEPGVTFGDLYTYCFERKLKVWPSTASLGWGSVVGNVREESGAVFNKYTNTLLDLRSRCGFRAVWITS